ncbi:PREDICTED: protein CCSMST1 [Elephantulus edwardii]|uniref:protein CCSMST1 n=1 Tax=Elephantulus edwardii TaxID=28737 RepID=UPI0003F0D854|nr:PREDICTED: protein CCSMST1 [Elephantulus edwardii]
MAAWSSVLFPVLRDGSDESAVRRCVERGLDGWMNRVLCSPAAGAARALRFARWSSPSSHSTSGGQARVQRVTEAEKDLYQPIPFSSSKANPSRWRVEHSLGKMQQRPWWKVLPLSFSLLAFVVWCYLRRESSSDAWLSEELEEEPEPRDRFEEHVTARI